MFTFIHLEAKHGFVVYGLCACLVICRSLVQFPTPLEAFVFAGDVIGGFLGHFSWTSMMTPGFVASETRKAFVLKLLCATCSLCCAPLKAHITWLGTFPRFYLEIKLRT